LFVVQGNGAQTPLVAPIAKEHVTHAQHEHALVG
jgi:hypothetical protein